MNPTPQTPLNKLEIAIAAYLQNLALAAMPLERLNFYPSQSSVQKTLPACIVFAEKAAERVIGSGVYEGVLYVYPFTQKDDDNNPASTVPTEYVQDSRISLIQEALRAQATVLSAINFPAQNRAVTSFHIFGFHEMEDKHADRERAFGEALCYEVSFANYSVSG